MSNNPKTEKGIVIGNVTDKYGTNNPVHRLLMDGFFRDARELSGKIAPNLIHEIGCGEGHLTRFLYRDDRVILGSDFSHKVIETASAMNDHTKYPIHFFVKSIYDLDESDYADLIVCCEVLEHLEQPETALERIAGTNCPHALFSVPREPIWRILNMLRGKYLSQRGNTPGHLNHWSRSAFVKLLARYFDIVDIRNPLPWTMVLCRKKSSRVR